MIASTFSIVGHDPAAGEWGIAISSKFLAVGAGIIWAKAGAGAIATQAMANLDFGEIGIQLLQKGYSAEAVAQSLLALDPDREERQFGIVDAKGGSYSFTGQNCFDYAGGITGPNFACQGNILVSRATVENMAETFQNSQGSLADRLMAALNAAQDAGGDKRGRQAAALLIVREGGSYGGYNDRAIDLRVDDHPQPVAELTRLYKLHQFYFTKSKPEDRLPLTEDRVKAIQEALKRRGFYQGEINGVWPGPARDALYGFCGWENYEERWMEDAIDAGVLDILLAE